MRTVQNSLKINFIPPPYDHHWGTYKEMRCPVCLAYADESQETCRVCGMTLGMLDDIFSDADLRLGPITDEGRALDPADLSVIRTFMQDFHQTFPQLILMVYVGHYPGKLQVGTRETAFWLANRARSTSFSFRHRRCTLMLYVDTQDKRAVLSAGYGFESFMEDDELKQALNQGRRYFRIGDYARGILCTLGALSAMLIAKASSTSAVH